MAACFLGLDLAWADTNPSGLAALDERGTLVDVCADRRSDADVLAWVRAHAGERGAIAIDMPTIVANASSQRACERELRADFQDARTPPGGRAAALLDALRDDGVVHACDVAPHDARTVAFETYPHAAAVALFGLARITKHKKKPRRSWDAVLAAWAAYRAHLETLRAAEPPLAVDAAHLPVAVNERRYKRWDDSIDAILCAYVASYVWHHGTASGRVRVYGDMARGHIVVPQRSHVKRAPGGYTAGV